MPSFMETALAALSHDSTLVNVERGIFVGTVLLLVLTLVYKTQRGSDDDDSGVQNDSPVAEKASRLSLG